MVVGRGALMGFLALLVIPVLLIVVLVGLKPAPSVQKSVPAAPAVAATVRAAPAPAAEQVKPAVAPTAVSAVSIPPTRAPAPATATPAVKAEALATIGSGLQGKNWLYEVTSVERPQTISDNQFIDGKAKGACVAVYVTMTNTGKENFGINSWDFELHDAAGVKYNVSSELAASMYGTQRHLTELGGQRPPGVPLKSVLLFDVAPTAKGLKLWLVQERKSIDLEPPPTV